MSNSSQSQTPCGTLYVAVGKKDQHVIKPLCKPMFDPHTTYLTKKDENQTRDLRIILNSMLTDYISVYLEDKLD